MPPVPVLVSSPVEVEPLAAALAPKPVAIGSAPALVAQRAATGKQLPFVDGLELAWDGTSSLKAATEALRNVNVLAHGARAGALQRLHTLDEMINHVPIAGLGPAPN